MRLPLAVLIAALSVAGPAWADKRIYSYDPADAPTRARVDNGLTFIFDKGVMGMRVREVLATQARARALVEPVGDRELGVKLEKVLPAGAAERELYAIADKDEGPAMVRAFCPGSTRGWLVFAPIRPRRSLTVHVLGDDGQGKAKLCTTLKLAFRGEWRTPNLNNPVPTLPPFVPPGRPQ
jgi:hypothetical protein